MKRPPGPFWDPGAFACRKRQPLFPQGDCAPCRVRLPVQKSPHMAREPHQKSAGGGRSGRVGKTPQAHTGRKMSFSRRMSPKMTEFLFLPPSPHWIAFGNHLWIAAWGLRRTECCETAFPGHFLFSACRPRLSPADSTPRKRAADPAPGRRPQEGQFLYLRLQVCRAPPRRPRV